MFCNECLPVIGSWVSVRLQLQSMTYLSKIVFRPFSPVHSKLFWFYFHHSSLFIIPSGVSFLYFEVMRYCYCSQGFVIGETEDLVSPSTLLQTQFTPGLIILIM